MKIFPATHYTMGGLWVDYESSVAGRLVIGAPRNQQTNIPGLYAIGECEYQYHGANRLGANSLVACIFAGLIVAPSVMSACESIPRGTAASQPAALFDGACGQHSAKCQQMLARPEGGANPYTVHQELGQVMTEAATVVRHNGELSRAYGTLCDLEDQARHCSLADNGSWSNQNVVFVRALQDMFPLARLIVQGALRRDECRGAHYKPEFSIPDITATEAEMQKRQAEQWCDRWEENNRRWLKSTIARMGGDGEPQLTYEDVDTTLIQPRPRLYGVTGGQMIEEVWRQRQRKQELQKDHLI